MFVPRFMRHPVLTPLFIHVSYSYWLAGWLTVTLNFLCVIVLEDRHTVRTVVWSAICRPPSDLHQKYVTTFSTVRSHDFPCGCAWEVTMLIFWCFQFLLTVSLRVIMRVISAVLVLSPWPPINFFVCHVAIDWKLEFCAFREFLQLIYAFQLKWSHIFRSCWETKMIL